MSTSQSVEDELDESFRAGDAVVASPPPPAAPPAPPPPPSPSPSGPLVNESGGPERRSDDPPPPPAAPESAGQGDADLAGPSGPPPLPPRPAPPMVERRKPLDDEVDGDERDDDAVNSGPGSTSYELDLLERKADHAAARMGAHRSQLEVIRSGSAIRFRNEFQRYVDGCRRGDTGVDADDTPVRFPTPNKISPNHHDLLCAAALMVRSGWVSPKMLDELDQLQAELHQGVCDLRQERSYARRRNWDGSPEIERQAERLSERVHAPRLERVERRARRVLARAAIPGDFETLAKEYRRDFTDYSATLADIVAEIGGVDSDE